LIKTKSRDLRPTSRLALRKYLLEVDVPTLIRAKASCEDKANTLKLIITYGLNAILPMRSKLKISNEPPWITQKLKHLIRRRQISLAEGDLISFRRLRNHVNRERKNCRSKFYEAKVKELKESAPAKWWRK
jgi:hypothetical protein